MYGLGMKYEMNQDIVVLATSRGLKKRRLPTVQLMDKILHDRQGTQVPL